MNIAFFGSSLVSAYWNGAATYYRGIIRALHGRGHAVTFYESDAYERQKHRDIADPDWATVVVYSHQGTDELERCLTAAAGADLIVKCSGNGVFDELLEARVPDLKTPRNLVAFWDVDAPATLCSRSSPRIAHSTPNSAPRSTTASIPARTTRRPATPASSATSASSAIGCPTVRPASRSSS